MPPSWKKSGRIARLISGLRSNRAAASSLSVETGFPTSLADLLVKNHSRLKTKKTAAAAAAAIHASSRPPSPPPPPNPASAPPPNPALMPSVTPPAAAPPPAVMPSVTPQRALMVRVGFNFLVAEMLALVLLAVGEKQLVFRITVVAFVLMVMDWLGFRVFELLTPCAEARKAIDSDFEAAVSRSVSSVSEGSVSGESVEMREEGVVPKVSRRKSWKRLVPKRLRSKRSAEKDSVVELDSGSDGRRVSSCGSEEEEPEICVVQSVEGNACECRSVSSRRLLLCVVLLFGLAGGRVAALAVTVAWFMLSGSIDTLWRKSRVDRLC